MNAISMLLAGNLLWDIWHDYVKIIMLIVMAVCAIFIILVVLFQPGNSSGISALGGQTETFLGKNKNKTFEHKMKKLTVVSSIVFGVLCVVFAIMAHIISQLG